ncbi:MAG: hypothetical protein ACFFED_03385 [Candidatus Thorarchaeota archaeon]
MTSELPDTLRGINLTKEGKKPMEKTIRISNPQKADVIAEAARGTILRILRAGIEDTLTEEHVDPSTKTRTIIQKQVIRDALSVSEIVKISKTFEEGKNPLTKSQVYHHLPILIEYSYVVHYGSVSTGKRSTDYYRRTANLFIFESFPRDDWKKFEETLTRIIDETIEVFGFNVTGSERRELIQLAMKTSEIEHESYQRVIPLAQGDIANPDFESLLRAVIATDASGSDEWVNARRRMREIFFKK